MQDRYPFDSTYALTNHIGLGLLLVATVFLVLATRQRQDVLKALA
jgi:hypothetical protein